MQIRLPSTAIHLPFTSQLPTPYTYMSHHLSSCEVIVDAQSSSAQEITSNLPLCELHTTSQLLAPHTYMNHYPSSCEVIRQYPLSTRLAPLLDNPQIATIR